MMPGLRIDRPRTAVSEFQSHLEDRLAEHFGRERPIAGIERRLSPYTSSVRIEELHVRFEDGARLQLIVKDTSEDALLDEARRARPAFLWDPSRESAVYRSILPLAPPGTAVTYGTVAEADEGRHWLLLERIDGLELRHVGAFSAWTDTARWIAAFHRSFPPAHLQGLRDTSTLPVYDEAFYRCWLGRARRFLAGHPAASRTLARIARVYEPVVERLAHMPRTVIHGEFYACNALIQTTGGERRVRPVDWEMTALGPGLIDLASLVTGWQSGAQQALAQAYFEVAADGPLEEPLPENRLVDLDCCRLYLALRMLGWSDDWQPPPQHSLDWLTEAADIADRLERDGRILLST
jgi:aminoglycoside phosphotransferase (APT) family kinase protein